MEVGSSSYDQFKKKNTTWFSWLVALRLAMNVGGSVGSFSNNQF